MEELMKNVYKTKMVLVLFFVLVANGACRKTGLGIRRNLLAKEGTMPALTTNQAVRERVRGHHDALYTKVDVLKVAPKKGKGGKTPKISKSSESSESAEDSTTSGGSKKSSKKSNKGSKGKGNIHERDGMFIPPHGSTDASILECSPESLLIGGIATTSITVGMIIFSISEPNPNGGPEVACEDCGTIIRIVTNVQPTDETSSSCPIGETCVNVSTELALVSDILIGDVIAFFNLQEAEDTEAELIFNCPYSYSSSTNRKTLGISHDNNNSVFMSLLEHPFHIDFGTRGRELQVGACQDLLAVNNDGRCAYTNCFVGEDSEPGDCYECGAMCDNGCGSGWNEILVPDSIWTVFDFREPCCILDHCYSTNTWGQVACDNYFYSNMLAQCADQSFFWKLVKFPFGFTNLDCQLAAWVYFKVVSLAGASAYTNAQAKQKSHEAKPDCAAECPSTQESGGQGTTVLSIDLKNPVGNFELFYEMYTIKDGLDVTYEGNTLFSTGGLVSGSATHSIPLPAGGTSTTVKVTITAPTSGTAWDVSVGCALPPL